MVFLHGHFFPEFLQRVSRSITVQVVMCLAADCNIAVHFLAGIGLFLFQIVIL
jgi:hypothetical protein